MIDNAFDPSRLDAALADQVRRERGRVPFPTHDDLTALAAGTLSLDDQRRVRRAIALHDGAWAAYADARAALGLAPVADDDDATEPAGETPVVVLPFRRLARLTTSPATREVPARMAAAGPTRPAPTWESFRNGDVSVTVFEDAPVLKARVEREGRPVQGAHVSVRESLQHETHAQAIAARQGRTNEHGEATLGPLDGFLPPRVGGSYLLVLSMGGE